MTLPSSGLITLSDVNVELGKAANSAITLNDAAVRALAGKSSGIITLADLYGKSSVFKYTFSANTSNVDLMSALISAGWQKDSEVLVTIPSGIIIWATSTSNAAMYISGTFPKGITILNQGLICGAGGNGGAGATAAYSTGSPGMSGGPAITNLSSSVKIDNGSGIIAGGGGGGGGGSRGTTAGAVGNGGGGRGYNNATINGSGTSGGTGGAGATGAGGTGGTTSAGGVGSGNNTQLSVPSAGGGGGGWGSAGGKGGLCYNRQSTGGNGGAALSGNSVAWISTGSRYGSVA